MIRPANYQHRRLVSNQLAYTDVQFENWYQAWDLQWIIVITVVLLVIRDTVTVKVLLYIRSRDHILTGVDTVTLTFFFYLLGEELLHMIGVGDIHNIEVMETLIRGIDLNGTNAEKLLKETACKRHIRDTIETYFIFCCI
jgi:hypothetical protein